MFACWLTYVYFNVFTNNVNKKMNKKQLFLAALFPIEIRTLSHIISLKFADYLMLTGIAAFLIDYRLGIIVGAGPAEAVFNVDGLEPFGYFVSDWLG